MYYRMKHVYQQSPMTVNSKDTDKKNIERNMLRNCLLSHTEIHTREHLFFSPAKKIIRVTSENLVFRTLASCVRCSSSVGFGYFRRGVMALPGKSALSAVSSNASQVSRVSSFSGDLG